MIKAIAFFTKWFLFPIVFMPIIYLDISLITTIGFFLFLFLVFCIRQIESLVKKELLSQGYNDYWNKITCDSKIVDLFLEIIIIFTFVSLFTYFF
ncbi:hypothetical protein [Natronospora cellulosivora (SeqCode)]